MARPASDVSDVDARREAFGESVDEWQRDVEQARVVEGPALFCHERLERGVARVGHAAAVPEALDDLVLDAREEAHVLGLDGEVLGPGGARQPRGVRGGSS